jgi:hypothetical protein
LARIQASLVPISRQVAALGWLVPLDRRDEPARFGDLGGVRQWVIAIIDPLKDQLGLEQH